MAQTILEKRTADNRLFDIDCQDLLDSGETIASVGAFSSDDTALTFTAGTVNTAQVSYPDGTTAPIGTVVQVKIGAGNANFGKLATVKCTVTTSEGNVIEAAALLQVKDTV